MVAWWPAEDNANDVINGNNGTMEGDAGFAPGEVGQAFSLDGVGYIYVQPSSTLDIGSDIASGGATGLTIEGWVNPSSEVIDGWPGAPIAEYDSASATGMQLWYYSGQLFANFVDVSGNSHAVYSGVSLTADVFQHVALTYDYSTGSVVFYVNGSQRYVSNIGSVIPQTSYAFNIGGRTASGWGQGINFEGEIDELSLYSRALSGSEIQAIYNAGSAGKGGFVSTPPACAFIPNLSYYPVAWWTGDEDASASSAYYSIDNGDIIGNVSFAVGEVRRAFTLDGVNSYISVPASAGLDIGSLNNNYSFTIEGWINPDSDVVNGWPGAPIIEWDIDSASGVQLWYYSGQLFANIVDTDGNSHAVYSNTPLEAGVFQHVALTYDGATTGNVVFYVNGTPVCTKFIGFVSPQTSYPVNIGRRTAQGSWYGVNFGGQIDELTLYGGVLSPSDIQTIYSAGLAGKRW
jgi:hypothetical protein